MVSGKSLKIVYVIPSTGISGGIYVVSEHATRLAARGHRVSLAIASEGPRNLPWLPGCRVPVIGLEDIPPDTDALIATWWETTYAIGVIPARTKFFLVQSIEPRFYSKEQKAEVIFSTLAYHFDYHFITIAQWLSDWLKKTYHREVCLVKNQLNGDIFHHVDPSTEVLESLTGTNAYLSMKVRSRLPAVVQVFWDNGGGFFERDSFVFRIDREWREKSVVLKNFQRIKNIRIDTDGCDAITVEFASLVLVTDSGSRLDLLQPRHWTINDQISSMVIRNGLLQVRSFGPDPYIILSGGSTALDELRNPKPSPAKERMRILVEGPIGVDFKNVERAVNLARKTGCEVWVVDGKAVGASFNCLCPDRIFNCVPMDKMKYIYASCDILLRLSRIESFSYPPLEMMACGGVSVVGDVEGIHEYMVDGYNGFIVDLNDERKIMKALIALIDDEKLRKKLRRGGRETVEGNSCWEAQIDVLESFLRAKVEEASHAAARKEHTFTFNDKEFSKLYNAVANQRADYTGG